MPEKRLDENKRSNLKNSLIENTHFLPPINLTYEFINVFIIIPYINNFARIFYFLQQFDINKVTLLIENQKGRHIP
jgi:hypothetical protein